MPGYIYIYIYIHVYIYIGSRLGVPRNAITSYKNGFWKCWFCTGFYNVLWLRVNVQDHRKCHMLRGQTSSLSAQKHPYVTQLCGRQKMLVSFFIRNCGFMYLLSFCWLLKSVIIHWRTMGDMTIRPFLSSHPQRLFETVASTYRHLQRIYIFNVSTCSMHPHLQPINIFNLSTSSTYQHLPRSHIFSVSTSSTHPHLQRIHIFTSSLDGAQWTLLSPNPPTPPICI